ncbi:MAG: CheR family methyltransferase [Thermoanaerobaculia bacterium]
MSVHGTPASHLLELAALVRRETGNELPEGRLAFLGEAAERRRDITGFADLAAYIAALGADELPGEWEVLATLLTIKESSFFRVPLQWEKLRDRLLPELLERRSATRRLRFWSAACAAGEEPATLALVLDQSPFLTGWDWRILATDLDPEALAHARRGLYGERAIASVPEKMLASSFRRQGTLFELEPRLRERIEYRPLNLARIPFRLPEPAFDVILLRNVLIYFRQDLQAAVVAEASRRLAPGGALFLGGSETLWRVQERLRAVDLGGCFCYRLPEAAMGGGNDGNDGSAAREKDRSIATAQRKDSGRPSTAVRAPTSAGAAGTTGAAAPPETGEIHLPVRRRRSGMHENRNPSPAPSPAPNSERILTAIRHLEADQIPAAAREAELALASDPADPAAHALAGLVHDISGRVEEAADAFRAALYLEPDLPQVRFLLAASLRRAGKLELALRQAREVVMTLERGPGRRLPALDGRLLASPAETLRLARAALERWPAGE